LETAHPAKFSEVIHEILGVNPEIPETLQEYLNKEKVSIPMKPVYEELKAYLKTRKNK
jgi:threonine synthase